MDRCTKVKYMLWLYLTDWIVIRLGDLTQAFKDVIFWGQRGRQNGKLMQTRASPSCMPRSHRSLMAMRKGLLSVSSAM